MKEYLKNHISFVEAALAKNNENSDWGALRQFHRSRITFFQHERLVHLLVTLFFGLVFFFTAILCFLLASLELLALGVILLALLAFYVRHYFIMENGVQKLYQLDEEIEKFLKV